MEGFTYLGTIDDMVVKYPWRFNVTEKSLNHSLVIQLIDGRPILLNDGYLVQHRLGRAALLDKNSLLWELIKSEFVRVMARGGRRYGLAEMPVKMAEEGIVSYQWIVDDQVQGVLWAELRGALDVLDATLTKSNYLIGWPAYDTGSGFRELAEAMRNNASTAHSLGLAKHVRSGVIPGFLDEFIDKMNKDTGKPRSRWETMAKRYANKPDNTNRPKEFQRAMMNLANEMYHYNMGVMLSAEHDVPIAVETQTSAAFDDLLVYRNTLLEESDVHRLRIPLALTTVDPLRLVKVLEVGTKVFEARQQWLMQRQAAESSRKPLTKIQGSELMDTGKRYAAELSKLLGEHVRYDESEGLFSYVVGLAVKSSVTPALLAAGGAASIGASPVVAGAIAVATGFVVYRAQKAVLGGVTKKFKISLLKGQVLPPELVRRSAEIVRRIKGRQAPSSIEISRSTATALAAKMSRFEPQT
jgi:hypothetical protein